MARVSWLEERGEFRAQIPRVAWIQSISPKNKATVGDFYYLIQVDRGLLGVTRLGDQNVHETMASFGYPQTLVREYSRWVVVLRSKQVTLGSCVLICTESATAFSDISVEAFAEFGSVIRDLEHALSAAFSYDKINYLMLMMVDPQVHFHVIPRYDHLVSFGGEEFADSGWPGPPDLGAGPMVDGERAERLIGRLKNA